MLKKKLSWLLLISFIFTMGAALHACGQADSEKADVGITLKGALE